MRCLSHMGSFVSPEESEAEMLLSGHCQAEVAEVREAFRQNLEEGKEVGAAFAVVRGEEVLVDLYGGYANARQSLPWRRDKIVCVQSVTKSLVALSLALLVDRGRLSYETPVAAVWPDFAQNGKEAITLEQVLSHQAGLNGIRESLALEDLYRGRRFAEALERMAPLYPPGSKCIYHALSFGVLAAEILRRVDGRSLGTFLREEIAEPLDLQIYLGLPLADDHRAVKIVPDADADQVMEEASRRPEAFGYVNPRVRPEEPNTRAWRAAEVGAGGAHADAISLARLYAVLAAGGSTTRHRLLRKATLDQATRERFDGDEAGFGWPIRFAAGFMLNKDRVFGPTPHAFGHSGWGGHLAFADPERGIGVAYVANRMATFGGGADPRRAKLLDALYRSLDAS